MAGKTTRVVMPQLGESVHEGTISKWLVKPGDKVVEFEPMLEVDTDKVNAEVPAPVSGILREILAKEGDTVQAGAEIAVVETGDGAAEVLPPGGQVAAPEVLPAGGGGAGGSGDLGAGVAAQRPEGPTERRPAPPAPSAPPPPEGGGQASSPAPGPSAAPPPRAGGHEEEHRYSPGVQMAASELKVDLSQVAGTGLGGRVTRKDVESFAARAKAAPSAPAAPPSPAPAKPSEGDEVVQLTRVRRLIAENMTRSKQTIPHAWQTQEVDMSGVVASRNANKGAFQKQEGFSLTYLPYVMAAAISSLREHREVNATFNDSELIIHRDINLGISVGMEDTLLVPVVRHADSLSLRSEEHTSELQSHVNLVCRLLLEKKNLVLGNPVVGVEQTDACIIRDDQTIKTPLLPQHFGQQETGSVAGFIVNIMISRHYGAGMALLHCHFERKHEDIVQLFEAEMHRGMIARSFADFFFNNAATTEIYTLSLHDALPI